MSAVQLGAGEELVELIAGRGRDDLLERHDVRFDPSQFLIDGFSPSIVALDVFDVDSEYAQTSHTGWVTDRTLTYAVGTVNDGSSRLFPVDF
jgi:hypothetical protein